MKLQNVEVILNYETDDGNPFTIKGVVTANGWNQWGAEKEVLGDNVPVMEKIGDAVGNFLIDDFEVDDLNEKK